MIEARLIEPGADMRHRKQLVKLNRPSDQRISLLKTLAKQLIEHGQLVTTEARAKALSPFISAIIHKAIDGNVNDMRIINTNLNDRRMVYKLKHEIVPKLLRKKDGGYITVIKMPPRRGDGAMMAMIRINSEQAE